MKAKYSVHLKLFNVAASFSEAILYQKKG